MLRNVESHSDWFGTALKQSFERKFRRRCTAAALALKFNTEISISERGISTETARRWLKGLSLPEPRRMSALVDWLKIETVDLSGSRSGCKGEVLAAANGEQGSPQSIGHYDLVTFQCSPQDLEVLRRLLSAMLRVEPDPKQSRPSK